jgi:hypothetical protein
MPTTSSNRATPLPRPLLDALLEDRVLPIIGAGFSLNGILPGDRRMLNWDQLGAALAAEVAYVGPRADPLEIISAYAAEHGRQSLVARLRRALNDGAVEPGEVHTAFAQLPFDIVVTTNFDGLLEDAYRAVHRPLRTLIREDQLASLVPRSAVAVVKAHGDYDNEPVLIATEQDYDEFLLRRPLLATYLANLLITRVALLIGYSLSDSDWRQLLAAVRTRLGRSQQTVYAIEVDAGPAVVERFRRRGVTLIDVRSEGRPYGQVLLQLFEDMRAHLAAHTLDDSIVRDEGALEELRAASRDERRLCLFLVPESLLAFYREHIFPLVREAGIQPITPYDVDARGATMYATVIALIEHTGAAVADLSEPEAGTWFEATLALGAGRAQRVPLLVVGSAGNGPPFLPSGVEPGAYLFRDSGLDPSFPPSLLKWLNRVLQPVGRRRREPIDRHRDEPGWSVVRAFRDLELALAARYDTGRLRDGLARAVDEKALSERDADSLLKAYRLRNEVLHQGYIPSPAEAARVVQTVTRAARQLRRP